MTKNQNHSIQLILDNELKHSDKEHYKNLFRSLPDLGENKLNITAIEIDLNDSDKIKVLSIIRSTLIKDIKLAKTSISLVNREMKVISEKEEDFRALGTIKKNTAYLYSLEFPKKEIILTNFDEVKDWSLAFSNNLSHKVDYSDLDESKIPQTTRDYLQNIVDQTPLNKNELSFLGFSTKLDNENNLHLNLLIRNGTKDTLDIKQLPLKLFDATGDLTAQGSFKMEGVSVLANTSKPISLVFPAESVLKENPDLSSWSVQHVEG